MATSAEATTARSTAPGALAGQSRVRRRATIWTSIRRQRLALTGFLIVATIAVLAVIGPAVAPRDPTAQVMSDRFHAPSRDYLLGTDEFGRDILSRLLHGARISFQVGIVAVGIAGTAGVLFGMLAGYRGGWVDNIISLLMDIIFAFPAVLLAIAFITLRGNNLTNAMIAIAIVYTPPFARVVRGAVLTVRHTAYVEAAVALGGSTPRILARHVFPNITAPLIVQTSLAFALAVLSEAALAFLGLGNKAPAPSWGSMVDGSYEYLQIAAWPTIFPGIAIAVTVLGFNLLGDGLRDAFDPRLRTQAGVR